MLKVVNSIRNFIRKTEECVPDFHQLKFQIGIIHCAYKIAAKKLKNHL